MSSHWYDHQSVEEKWQQIWEEQGLFQNTAGQVVKDPLYLLFALAYTSGSGLHVGHVESKTALDINARYYRMNGKDVFFPVGWDAFGLPAENYAIKTGVPPVETTRQAIKTFREQIKRIGISYDWDTETATCHPGYYRWTQWIFLQLFNKGLAYQKQAPVNWCPSCQTVLANEQVVDGRCERCDSEVVQKSMKQWFFRITDYKDELIEGLNQVDWPEPTVQQQINWIGKAEGLSIDFMLKQTQKKMTVWTKFWETVYGTTFVVIAPEKFQELGLMSVVSDDLKQSVESYLVAAQKKTEEERKIGEKDKTGVNTGLTLINPVNQQEVPLFIADYVLVGVGTAVVMGVPAHDERDFGFAKKFELPIIQVVSYEDKEIDQKVANGEVPFEGPGILVNSGQFDGQDAHGKGKADMAEWMISQGFANWQTTYRLRDWLVSRQRYWGAPIPIVYDPDGNAHPVKEEHLPWILPTDVDFKPTGESPLKSSKEFIERTERLYGEGWRPEFDTMDTFVDSSWYFMRYTDARNEAEFASKEQLKKWLPVDLYMIGPEHIVLHLLYARFFTKFLRDEGYLDFDEPFMKMRHQGMILGPDGKKMSKSKGNVINPDEIVDKFGADTLRVYEMFMGPLEADKPWDVKAVMGVYKFLQRVNSAVEEQIGLADKSVGENIDVKRKLHQTIKKVGSDIPELKFNTAIAAMMEFINEWEAAQRAAHSSDPISRVLSDEEVLAFLKILAPFAPFLTEELYHRLSSTAETNSIHQQTWPEFDQELVESGVVAMGVQVNGKVRDTLEISPDQLDDQSAVLSAARDLPGVQKYLADKQIKKEIYIKGRIISFVVA